MTRRVVTAREQVGMMAPWRGAAAGHSEYTRKLLDDVRAATGISLDVEDTGGSHVLSGRLEDGSWVVAGDGWDGDVHPDQGHRARHEAETGKPKGWYVQLFNNSTVERGAGPIQGWGVDQDGYYVDPYHDHTDMGAYTHELPRVIADALRSVPPGAKHRPDGDGAAPAPREVPDYENLVNPRQDLDDDFGDIFGGGK